MFSMPGKVPSFSIEASQRGWRWVVGAIIRFRYVVGAAIIVGLTFSVAYVVFRPTWYTAVAQVQLTNMRLTFSRDDAIFAEAQYDPAFIETQIQILKSRRIALAVVDHLKLADQRDQNNGGSPDTVAGKFAAFLSSSASDVEEAASDRRSAALKTLQRGLSVDRIALSNVVEITFTSPNAEQAAQIANDIVRSYIADQNAARVDAAQAGSSWLRERLREVGPKTRVIATAEPPTDKSNPRGLLVIASFVLACGAAAVILALVSTFFDRKIRTPEQAMEASGSPFLGIVPVLTTHEKLSKAKQKKKAAKGLMARILSKAESSETEEGAELLLTLTNTRLWRDVPWNEWPHTVGITSLSRGEGRTTVAKNLALSLVISGHKVLLIDANACPGNLTKKRDYCHKSGGTEAIDLSQHVTIDMESGLYFLELSGLNSASSFDWDERMSSLLVGSKVAYEYVIVDLPSLARSSGVSPVAELIQSIVLVVGWGDVSIEQMQVGLCLAEPIRAKLIGCILNKIDLRQVRWMTSPELDFIRLRKLRG